MNNIDISITYSNSHNSSLRYDFNDFRKDGMPMQGSSTTTIEPRIRYTLSERVTASLYYRYSKLSPDAGGATISGSTTNEAEWILTSLLNNPILETWTMNLFISNNICKRN